MGHHAIKRWVERRRRCGSGQQNGIWLDGNGYDNGAWMCSGICCGFGANNSPHNQQEIDEFCTAQVDIATRGRQHIIANGGFDFNCYTYMVQELPRAKVEFL